MTTYMPPGNQDLNTLLCLVTTPQNIEPTTIQPDNVDSRDDTTNDITPDIPIEYNQTEESHNPEPNHNAEPCPSENKSAT